MCFRKKMILIIGQLLIPPTSECKPNLWRSSRVMLIVKIVITTAAAILYMLIFFPALRPYILLGPWRATSSAATFSDDGDASLGAVASESSICSRAGIDMLKRGGNAADSVGKLSPQVMTSFTDLVKMVATVFCVGVIGREPLLSTTVNLLS